MIAGRLPGLSVLLAINDTKKLEQEIVAKTRFFASANVKIFG